MNRRAVYRGARPLLAFAASGALIALSCPPAGAVAAQHTPPAAGPSAAPAAASTPARGSLAARQVGGPLMARRGLVVAAHAPPPPHVPASAWVIANAGTGQVLAAMDPHGEFGPASTLKVLTAVTLIPLLNPDGMVVATRLAASQEENDVGLIPDRSYRVSSLFQALLLMSANDAAVALTQATGSFTHGMALINAEARHLQAYDVDAKLPNGLPAAGQVTSAYDEALIARQALAIPAFLKYDETLGARFELKPHHWVAFANQNYLLTQYRGGIGGKIGWTESSEATYVGLARRNGVTLIATVLHCTSLLEIKAAEKLLNWGFANNGKVAPVGVLVPPLATTAAVHVHADPARPGPVVLVSSKTGTAASPVGYGLAAGGVLVAALGLGALAATRRRSPGRGRS